MKCKLYILLLTVVCLFGVSPPDIQAQTTSPPLRQCIGSRAVFAARSDTTNSVWRSDTLATFRLRITDLSGNPGGGRFVDSTRYDSLVVEWGMTEGLYLIGVQEVAYGGCEGEWTYMMVDLKGTQFVPESSYRLTGGELLVPINPNLWKNVRWTPNTVTNGQPPGTFKISQVGTYQVTMEDMHGCKHSETITVTN